MDDEEKRIISGVTKTLTKLGFSREEITDVMIWVLFVRRTRDIQREIDNLYHVERDGLEPLEQLEGKDHV